jgi:uncharacterized protein (DUF983 family)
VTGDDPRYPRRLLHAVRRGLALTCPRCGQAPLFASYLKLAPECSACTEPFGGMRTADAAPYFTVLVVGHIVVIPLVFVEKMAAPPLWVHYAIWPATALAATFLVLPRVKGAIIGWMWWLGLKGDEVQ